MTRGRRFGPAALAAAAVLAALPAVAPSPALAQDDGVVRIVVGQGPRFGFQLQEGPPPVVGRVYPGSPAEKAGVRAGDAILRVDGREATVRTLLRVAREADEGARVTLRVRRGDREMDVPVVLDTGWRKETVVVIDADSIRQLTRKYLDEAREAFQNQEFEFDFDFDGFEFDFEPGEFAFVWPDSLGEGFRVFQDDDGAVGYAYGYGAGFHGTPPALRGARLSELNPGLARHFEGVREGLLVLDVEPGSRAARAGLQPGDVIVRAGDRAVRDIESLWRGTRGREAAALTVVRDGRETTLRLERR